jgi:hypothetical protein
VSNNSEVEASRFARSVEEIEKLIRSGGDISGYPLAAALESKQARLDAIRAEDEHVTTEKKEKDQKDRSAIAQMVEREAKLNKEEKEKYANFLSKDYFTRSDLKELDRFYADGGAYDRLSDEGKAQMSHRVEEGIRRGEISREELPDNIKRKNDEFMRQSSDKGKSSETPEIKSSGSYQTESSKLENSVIGVNKPDRDTNSFTLEGKVEVPDALAGLAKLSPVQETESVVVPQTERSGQGQTRGG